MPQKQVLRDHQFHAGTTEDRSSSAGIANRVAFEENEVILVTGHDLNHSFFC